MEGPSKQGGWKIPQDELEGRPVLTGVVGCHTPRHNFCRHRTKSGISVGQ